MVQPKEVFREGETLVWVREMGEAEATQVPIATLEKRMLHEMMTARSEYLAEKVPAFIDAVTPFINDHDPRDGSSVRDAYDTLYNVSVNGAHPSGPGCHLITLSVKVLQEWHASLCGVPVQEYEPFTLTIKGTLALPTE